MIISQVINYIMDFIEESWQVTIFLKISIV